MTTKPVKGIKPIIDANGKVVGLKRIHKFPSKSAAIAASKSRKQRPVRRIV
jgi:hypothetical protein